MKKKISFSTAISYVFIAMTVTFCLTMVISSKMFESKVASVNEKETMYDKIADIDQTVRQNYYTSLDDTRVTEGMARGYVRGLNDADSLYYSVRKMSEYQDIQAGKVIGIGVDIIKSREDGGYMKVYNVYTDSPADVQGIVSGDTITAIDGISTINMQVETARQMLSGLSGTTLELTYVHEGSETTATLTHKAYDAPSVISSKEGDYGYLKITSFNAKTASELEYSANNLIGQEVKALVIDVRDNASKDFDSAAAAADILLKEGTTMYAVYQDGEKKVLYTSDKTSMSVPIVLVTNSGTGYASEMFTIMLKDIAGAKTVGTTTMGKGGLQKMFRLPDGSGVELTVAILNPITSRVYNGTGIVADYEKTLDASQELTYVTMSPSEDPQVVRAFEVAGNLSK